MPHVVGLSNGLHFAKSLSGQKGFSAVPYEHRFFPDGEHYVRFPKSIAGKEIVLVQSMHPFPNDAIMELFFAARTAKELGAKKVTGLIPYIGYMRQDNRFHEGESFSAKEMAWFLSQFLDSVVTFDAHLHRLKKMSEIFSVDAHNLHSAKSIAVFLDKSFSKKNTIVVGPDSESSQWAKKIADEIGFDATILSKTRYSDRKVKVHLKDGSLFAKKSVVIVDDIVSTGKTIISAAKEIFRHKPKEVCVVCVHPLLVEGALGKLNAAGIKKVFSCNTVEHKTNKIDLAQAAAGHLRGD